MVHRDLLFRIILDRRLLFVSPAGHVSQNSWTARVHDLDGIHPFLAGQTNNWG